jgi:hypothetical protein
MCRSGKVAYRKKAAAEREMRKMLNSKRRDPRPGLATKVYACHLCPAWHIGHQHEAIPAHRRR